MRSCLDSLGGLLPVSLIRLSTYTLKSVLISPDSTGQTVIVPDYSDDPDWNDADLDFGDEDAQDLEKAWENRGI